MKTYTYYKMVLGLSLLLFSLFIPVVVRAADYTVDGYVYTNEATPQPVEGAAVVFVDASDVEWSTFTDASGYFSLVLAEGTYTVTVYPPDPSNLSGYIVGDVSLAADLTLPDVALNYITSPTTVSGTVYSPLDIALPGSNVFLYHGDYFYSYTTDVSGYYSVTCPDDDVYHYAVYPPEGPIHDYHYDGFEVSGATTKNIVLVGNMSPVVLGTITNNYGYPVKGATVHFVGSPASNPDGRFGPYVSTSGNDGSYTFRVPPTDYDITVYPPKHQGYKRYLETGYTVPPVGPVTKDYELEAPFPVSVNVVDGSSLDEIHLADHTSDLDEGNYIVLSTGDVTVDLPQPMVSDYSGPREVNREVSGKQVSVFSAFESRTVTSPIYTWELYYSPVTFTLNYYGDGRLSGDSVDIRLLSATYSELLDAVTEAKNGNTQPLKDLLTLNVVDSATLILDANGDFADEPFTINTAGDYVVAVVHEDTSNPDNYRLWVYSAAPIEVLDYPVTVTPDYDPASPDFLDVYINLDVTPGATYSYATVLIKEDVYNLHSITTTDGTVDGTTVEVEHMPIGSGTTTIAASGEIFGIPYANYMDLLDVDLLQTKLGDIYALNEYTVGSNIETTEVVDVMLSPDVDATFQGSYVMTTVVWEHGTDKRIVAFDQQVIVLGEVVTIDSVTSNMPQPYANLVNIDFQVTSGVVYTGATAEFTFSINGNPIAATNNMVIDIDATTQSYTYVWDTLLKVPRTYKAGGAVEFTLTIKDAGDNVLATTTGTGSLTAASKSTVFLGRLNPLAAQWAVSTPAQKSVIFTTYLNPLAALWAEL